MNRHRRSLSLSLSLSNIYPLSKSLSFLFFWHITSHHCTAQTTTNITLQFITAYIAYIKKLGHDSNRPVGNIEAVSGLASLVCALPIGYLADTIGRSVVIRAGGILLFITAILQISILQYTVGIDVDNPNDDHKDNIALWVS
jgi:MFS family permease